MFTHPGRTVHRYNLICRKGFPIDGGGKFWKCFKKMETIRMRNSLILRKSSLHSWNLLNLMKFSVPRDVLKRSGSFFQLCAPGWRTRGWWRPSHRDWACSSLEAGKFRAGFRTAGAAENFSAAAAPPCPEHTMP